MRESTCLSFCVLLVVSIVVFISYDHFPICWNSFSILLAFTALQSLLGFYRYADFGFTFIDEVYYLTISVRQCLMLPLFVYQFSTQNEVSCTCMSFGCITWILLLLHLGIQQVEAWNVNLRLLDIVVVFDTFVILLICLEYHNYYALNAIGTYLFAYFIVTDKYTYMDMPAIDFHNYCLCFYVFFAWRALAV